MAKRLMLALGGNAILPAGKAGTIQEQREITQRTLRPLAEMIEPDDHLVISHGNGPIVGNILLRNEAASEDIPPMPLDICGADSQGGIGYMIVQCLQNALLRAKKNRDVAAVVTRVRVEREDPAFQNPSKPIGPFYSREQAQHFAAARGWAIIEDAGRGWRRVVGSPTPREVLELKSIQALLSQGHIVVAVGGGGIPVVSAEDGRYQGIEAVIDKDRSSGLLATALGLRSLVIVTSISHVAVDFGKPTQRNLEHVSAAEIQKYLAAGEFGRGSMMPKMEAALDFLKNGGAEVIVTSTDTLGPALLGQAGTRIVP